MAWWRSALVATLFLTSTPVLAQVDLAGQWQTINHLEARTRGPGPDLADYLGIPLNDEGRAVALSFSYTMVSMTERMCMYNSQNLLTNDAPSLEIARVNNPVNGNLIGWKLSGGGSVRDPLPIWLDGRQRPSQNGLHTSAGFTLGEWDGPVLRGSMTHMKRGITARNGSPLSEQATMTIHIVRNEDILTILTVTEDPVYLEAPLAQSATFLFNPVGNVNPVNAPCYPIVEVPRLDQPGSVPHYLPGTNPFADEFAKRWNLPLEAAHGGAQTMYPEFRKKLKDGYKIPAPCKANARQDCIFTSDR
jgi:hypothetical protein